MGLIDIYPTLVDLCSLKSPAQQLAGRSLRPLLENPKAAWDRPALTTYGENLGTVRDERYRYIRYPSGAEELYDHQSDAKEWKNLSKRADISKVKTRLARSMPKEWAPTMGGKLG